MKYSDDCKVYRIRYYNVWFYLFAKTEMDEYKINILGERIGMGDSMMMKDIHCWCTRQNIRYTVCGFCSPWYRLFFAQDEGGERTIRLVVLLPFSGNLCWVSS